MIKVDAVIRVPARESGGETSREITLDPHPIWEGDQPAVELAAFTSGRIIEIADLREALDRAERLIMEDRS